MYYIQQEKKCPQRIFRKGNEMLYDYGIIELLLLFVLTLFLVNKAQRHGRKQSQKISCAPYKLEVSQEELSAPVHPHRALQELLPASASASVKEFEQKFPPRQRIKLGSFLEPEEFVTEVRTKERSHPKKHGYGYNQYGRPRRFDFA